ncbi:MAG: PorT family protein [Cyclobacteriaceae bacterium]|nr:PorT family protein [Cyclobacteriaceae bacterium]
MKYIFLVIILTLSLLSNAQQSVGFSLGGNFSNVKFKNSSGVVDKNLKGLPGITATMLYSLKLNEQTKKKQSAHLLGIEAGYKSSKFEDKENSLLTTWQMQYITSVLTYRYSPNFLSKTGLFFGGGLSYDFLLSGSQTQGFSQFDITEELSRVNLSINIETGIRYNISDEAYTTLLVSYLRGLNNLEKDLNQQATIHSFRVAATVFFRINRK